MRACVVASGNRALADRKVAWNATTRQRGAISLAS